jgi:hypothetical protein
MLHERRLRCEALIAREIDKTPVRSPPVRRATTAAGMPPSIRKLTTVLLRNESDKAIGRRDPWKLEVCLHVVTRIRGMRCHDTPQI